jgi:signal transduction histidine kinase
MTYGLHLGATLVSLLLYSLTAGWVLTRREGLAAQTYGAAMASGGLLMGTVLGRLLAGGQAAMELFWYARYPFMWANAVLFPVFALAYTNREDLIDRRLLGTLGAVYLLGVGTLWLEPAGGPRLVWTGFEVVDAPFPHLVPTGRGPLFPVQVLTALSLVSVGVALPTRRLLRSRRGSRRQLLLVFGAVPIFVGVYVLQTVGLVPVAEFDYGLVAGGLTLPMIGYGLFEGYAFVVDPVSLDEVLDSVSDGVVVLDGERVVEYNAAAVVVFPDLEGAFGRSIASVAPTLLASRPTGGETDPVFVERFAVVRDDQRKRYVVDRTSLDGAATGSDRQTLVLRDVTESEERAERLGRQTEQLEEFASTMSHDLRNPLNVAQSQAETLRRRRADDDDDVDDADSIAAITASLDRAFQIIDETLTLARMGRAIEQREPVVLSEVATEAWRTVETGAATLSVEVDRGSMLYCDRERLRTLCENCFRNSVEHATGDGDAVTTPDDGPSEATLTVFVGDTPEGFYVEDDGRGLRTDPERAFERGHTTGTDGTGIGLAVVQSIAEAHGWQAEAHSRGEAGGARIEFTGVDRVEVGESGAVVSGDSRPDAEPGLAAAPEAVDGGTDP